MGITILHMPEIQLPYTRRFPTIRSIPDGSQKVTIHLPLSSTRTRGGHLPPPPPLARAPPP
jgi:hypothetical protein